MNTFSLDIIALEKTFYTGDCISLVIPTTQGQYGIQANHINMVAAIVPGNLKFTVPDGEVTVAVVSEGMAKVEDNHVLLLVDTVERPEEIEENLAKRSAEEEKDELMQKKSFQDYHEAQTRMARSLNRLKKKNYNEAQ